MIGQMKQSPKMNATIAAGSVTPRLPHQPPATRAAAVSSARRRDAGYDEITR